MKARKCAKFQNAHAGLITTFYAINPMFHPSFVAVTSRINFLDECGDANTRNLVLSQNPHERKSQSLRVKLLSASPSSRYT